MTRDSNYYVLFNGDALRPPPALSSSSVCSSLMWVSGSCPFSTNLFRTAALEHLHKADAGLALVYEVNHATGGSVLRSEGEGDSVISWVRFCSNLSLWAARTILWAATRDPSSHSSVTSEKRLSSRNTSISFAATSLPSSSSVKCEY